MVNALRASGKTAVLVSEELDNAIIIEERNRGKYCVVFDPLDGSSNIDAGVNIGTIFGIYQIVSSCSANIWVSQSSLQSGSCRDRIRKGPSRMCFGRVGRWLQLDTQCTRLTSKFAYMFPSYSPRYGSSANLVLSTGSGVNGYTLDASLGEFILTHPEVSPTDAR
jgi:fructose-1,6-bisphosphatase I